jgi:hypothetical protein
MLESNAELARSRHQATQRFAAATQRNVAAQEQHAQELREISNERLNRETAVLEQMQAAEAETRSNAELLQQQHARTQERVSEHINELEGELQDQQIDPNRAIRGWRGVASAIAMAFGEFGRAFTGGPNAAMAIIERNIDRDIAAQKMAKQSTRERIAGKLNEYNRNRERFGDEQAALAATRASAYRAIETQAKIAAAKTGDEQRQMQAQQVADAARQQADANILNAAQLELDYQLKLNQVDFNQRLALGQRDKGWQQKMLHAAKLAKAGVTGSPLYEGATKEALHLKSEAEKMDDTMNRLEKLVFDPETGVGWEKWSSSEAEVAKSLASRLKMNIGKQMGLGALSGPDLELVEAIISSDPTRMRQAVSKAQLDSLRQSVTNGINIELKNRGFELIPGSTRLAVQPWEEPIGMRAGEVR